MSKENYAVRIAADAARWQFCLQYGFPVRNQNDRPAWMAFGEGPIRAGGATPQEAIDSVMKTMGLIK